MDQGQGQGNGFGQAAGWLLPLAALGAGIVRPQTAPAFASLSNELYRQDLGEERRRSAEEERAGRTAMSTHLATLYPDVNFDPSLPISAQTGLASIYDSRTKARTEAEEKRLKALDVERNRGALTKMADIQGQVGQELPEALQASLRGVTADAALSEPGLKAYERTQGSIEESAKRLASARALGRPFEETETVEITPQPSEQARALRETWQTFGGEDGEPEYSLDVPPLSVPPLSLTQVPDNVHALQRYVMETGIKPDDKNAEALAGQFNLPMRRLPGGKEAYRASVKPPFAPSVANVTDKSGQVTNVVTSVDPATGQPSLQHTVVPGPGGGPAGAPQQPLDMNGPEIQRSLSAVVQGRPDLAMERDRGFTPQEARAILADMRNSEAQASPHLAANIISMRVEALNAELKKAEAQAADGRSPVQARRQAATRVVKIQRMLDIYDAQYDAIVASGLRGVVPRGGAPTTPPQPMGGPNSDAAAARKALEDYGFVPRVGGR